MSSQVYQYYDIDEPI